MALAGDYAHTKSPDISMLCSGGGGVLAFVVYLSLSLGSHSGSLLSHLQLVPGQYGSDSNGSALQVQLQAGTPAPSSPGPAQPEAVGALSSAKLGKKKGPPVSRAGWGMAEPKDGASAEEQQVLLQSSSSVPSGRIPCGLHCSWAVSGCQQIPSKKNLPFPLQRHLCVLTAVL